MQALLDQKQAAEFLGVKPKTLELWRYNGNGPAFVRISKRCIRYRPEALDEWIALREVSSTSAERHVS